MNFSISELSQWLASTGRGGVVHASGDGAAAGSVDGVVTDSRVAAPGQLFVPLVAERDGHDFLGAAIERGVSAALCSGGEHRWREVVAAGAVAIEVDDTAAALTDIGRLARRRLGGSVIGITGSVGKTSVKDLSAAACRTQRSTWASERSFNNEIGVPLTLANAPDGTEVAVVEMGARGIGHIADLCSVAAPTIGVVTTVAMAHSELFGSIEAIAVAKGELVEALPADGSAVLNIDNPLVAAMASRTQARVVTVGRSPEALVSLGPVRLDDRLRPRFDLMIDGVGYPVALTVAGEHMALNAALAVAAAVAAGVDVAAAVAGVAEGRLSPMRMDVVAAADGGTIINDAYNANPTSMRAAMRSLVAFEADDRVAVVGAMAELGDEGDDEHGAVADEMNRAGIRVIAVSAPAYGRSAHHVDSIDEAVEALGPVKAGTVVLVKGSRVAGLERLADRLG